MEEKIINLSQAISSRLCHDLAGSIGAIDNCFPLFNHDKPDIQEKAKALAAEESNNLVGKIKFYRIAYGLAIGEDDVKLDLLSELLEGFFENTKVEFSLKVEKNLVEINPNLAKSILCFAVIIYENLVISGKVIFVLNSNSIVINGASGNLKIKDDRIDIIKGKSDIDIDTKNCIEYYIHELCKKINHKILVIQKNDTIEYQIVNNNSK